MPTWQGGVHLSGTPIWCDALRVRDVCFVSRADAVDALRHGQLIATAPTLAVLARSDKRYQPQAQLSVPYAHPFTLGTIRIELLRSGHSIGSASLLADIDGERVLYAGAVNPRGGGLGGAADLRACDTVILCARYGDARYEFPATDEVAGQTIDFARDVVDRGGIAAILVSSASRGLDVADRLAAAGVPTYAHRSIHHAAQKLRTISDLHVPPLRRWSATTANMPHGRALIWPTRLRDALAKIQLPAASAIALVSGRALDAEFVASLGADAAFAWSGHAGRDELMEYIEACGARTVFFTHQYAEHMAASLRGNLHAGVLAPPRQMSLFG